MTLNALGEPCPIPVLMLAKAIYTVEIGQELEVLSDDESSKVDIPVWCRMKQHDYLGYTPHEQGWSFKIRRAQ
ncbi:MAG: hypothetical protein NVSMB57_17220 [Actinomycetota bacterium]